jgi:glycosyltransferase involved in cell wall biosynthesis
MISVLIPTKDDAQRLPMALRPLVRAAVDGLVREVIVIDAGSKDATLEIADDAGCAILKLDAALPARLQAGADWARADWLLLLAPDAWLAEGWDEAARRHIERSPARPARFPGAGEGLLQRLGLGAPAPLARLTPRRLSPDGGRALRLPVRLLRVSGPGRA